MLSVFSLLALLTRLLTHVREVGDEYVQCREANDDVNEVCEDCINTEEVGYEIKIEQSDKSPVETTDCGEDEGCCVHMNFFIGD